MLKTIWSKEPDKKAFGLPGDKDQLRLVIYINLAYTILQIIDLQGYGFPCLRTLIPTVLDANHFESQG
jgi:hypothetical protein